MNCIPRMPLRHDTRSSLDLLFTQPNTEQAAEPPRLQIETQRTKTIVQVQIRDNAIWPKHIRGDDELQAKLLDMQAGESIKLTVDGFTGVWQKIADRTDGRPTNGIKPIEEAREHWNGLQLRRGEFVRIGQA